MLNLLGHWHVCRAVLRSVVLPTREKNVCAIMFEGFRVVVVLFRLVSSTVPRDFYDAVSATLACEIERLHGGMV